MFPQGLDLILGNDLDCVGLTLASAFTILFNNLVNMGLPAHSDFPLHYVLPQVVSSDDPHIERLSPLFTNLGDRGPLFGTRGRYTILTVGRLVRLNDEGCGEGAGT